MSRIPDQCKTRQEALENCYETATEYLEARSNHPQIAGEMFRYLRDACDKVKEFNKQIETRNNSQP
jgi:hypothetical protein